MKHGKQLRLRFPKRGGKQPGSGRPRLRDYPGVVGALVPHLQRKTFASARAVHVTQRVRPDVGYLRKQGPASVLLQAFRDATARNGMRIAHDSVQGHHLHLIVEADDSVRLSRGMQGLSVRVARRLNARLGRRGAVFADRYHARVLGTRREVGNAIRYVVGNYRHHTREYLPADYRDEYATRAEHPLSEPKSWLLRVGWRACSASAQRGGTVHAPPSGLPFASRRTNVSEPSWFCSTVPNPHRPPAPPSPTTAERPPQVEASCS